MERGDSRVDDPGQAASEGRHSQSNHTEIPGLHSPQASHE